eukprot:764463-Hanusia_phi.AAC.1
MPSFLVVILVVAVLIWAGDSHEQQSNVHVARLRPCMHLRGGKKVGRKSVAQYPEVEKVWKSKPVSEFEALLNREFRSAITEALECGKNCTCVDDWIENQPEPIYKTLHDAVARARQEIQKAFGQVPVEPIQDDSGSDIPDIFDVRKLEMSEEEDEEAYITKIVRTGQVWDEKQKTMDAAELQRTKEELLQKIGEKIQSLNALVDNEPPYSKEGPPNATGFEDVPGLSKNIANDARELGLKPKNAKKFLLGMRALELYLNEKEEENVIKNGDGDSHHFAPVVIVDTLHGSDSLNPLGKNSLLNMLKAKRMRMSKLSTCLGSIHLFLLFFLTMLPSSAERYCLLEMTWENRCEDTTSASSTTTRGRNWNTTLKVWEYSHEQHVDERVTIVVSVPWVAKNVRQQDK